MFIEIYRKPEGNHLKFEIIVSDRKTVDPDEDMLVIHNKLVELSEQINPESFSNEVLQKLSNLISEIKYEIYSEVMNRAIGSARQVLKDKFDYIFTEVENWAVDCQIGETRSIIADCMPERKRYYFGNEQAPCDPMKD